MSARLHVKLNQQIIEPQRAEEQIRFLHTLTLAIAESPDFDSALNIVLETVCKTQSWDYGEAWIPCPNETVLKLSSVSYSGSKGVSFCDSLSLQKFRSLSEELNFPQGIGLPGRVWALQQPEWQEDLSQTSEEIFPRSQIACECGIRSGVGIPIISNHQVLAVLVFFKLEVSFEDKRLVESLLAVAAQLSLVLQCKRVEDALRVSEARFEGFMNHSPALTSLEEKELAQLTLQSIGDAVQSIGDAVITTNTLGQVQYLNSVAEDLTGWTHLSAQGLPITEVFKLLNEKTREPVKNPVETALYDGHAVCLAKDTVLISRDGSEFAIEDSTAPIRAFHGQIIGAVVVFHDTSTTRQMSQQLTWQASHDSLTGLVNRREFENRVEQALNLAKAQNQPHTLCYLDLDRFKIINDTCGHIVGDELLRQVTTLFQNQVRTSDTLARLGGDEFGILLYNCPLEQGLRVAHKLRECTQVFRFVWEDKTFNISVSIGLVEINPDSEGVTSILSVADAACSAAKNKGRNRVHMYQANDSELTQQYGEMQWVTRITQALEEDRFCLYHQPIVSTAQRESDGEHYEVLLRLVDEMGNLVSPMAFIPAAERYNLMQAIDRWVIRTFFATQNMNPEFGCNCLYAINLSGASINDEQFIEFLHEQFALYQIPPASICFEITETVAIANLKKAAQFIRSLKDLGCRFALDDFGSGMSSFVYLKNLPVDYLKIDGSFVKNIVDEPIDLAMVEAINQIGHVMGIQTIAEFVENQDILEKIIALGIDYAQGYGIAKPSPLSENRVWGVGCGV